MLKTILKSMFKNKIISIFLIVEFTITIFLSLEAIETYTIVNTKRKTIHNMFDTKNTIVIKMTATDGDNFFKTYFDILDKLKTINGVERVGYYNVQDTDREVRDNLGNIKEYVFVNEDMLDIIHIKDNKGKIMPRHILNQSNIQDGLYPIITGELLKAKNKSIDISIGSEYKKTYKSVTVLENNLQFPGKNYMEDATVNLNKSVVLIIPNDGIKSNSLFRTFVKCNNKSTNKVKDSIYKRFNDKGIKVDVRIVEDDLNNYIKEKESSFIAQFKITICLAFFSILGTVVTLILSVNRRKREFGIRMSSGASKFYLLRLVYGEVMMIIVISYMISLAIYSSQRANTLNILGLKVYQLFSPWFSIKYLLCVFALIFLVSCTVIKTILKMQPRELIGGAR